MSDKHNEALSAFIDGELGEDETRFLLRAMEHDPELTARWRRYHLSRYVLQGGRVSGTAGFSSRLAEALETEPAAAGSDRGARGAVPWLRPLAGMAVAASVALVAFNALDVKTPTADTPVTREQPLAADNPNFDASEPLRQRATVASGSGRGSEAWSNPRIQAYLLRHNELAAQRGSRGLVPYVYLVSTPAEVATEREESVEAPAENAERGGARESQP